ncbi:MAG: lamin tail domain-containing protein [Schleiferiaceae bacterium]|nr:lamin tail domain-containing protein [Schleiferiaceae bacterium]
MRIIKTSHLCSLAAISLLISGCHTEDVPLRPSVTFSASPIVISEDNGVATLELILSEALTETLIAQLNIGGSAVKDEDYALSSEVLVIQPGELKGTVTIAALQDLEQEENEEITLELVESTSFINLTPGVLSILIEDDDSPSSGSLLILNEVLYDPSNNGLNGDANGDGVYVQDEDEFIEFVNLSATTMDLSGYKVFDATALGSNTPRHVFPTGSILSPGKALILFGGGTPSGSFGNALVQVASSGAINMNNAGDFITLRDDLDSTFLEFDITPLSDNPNESYTRNPDLTGSFEQHSAVNGLLFTPGTKVDGSPF